MSTARVPPRAHKEALCEGQRLFAGHDADHRLVEKFAEDMTMQDFIDAAEEQRDRTLRENARKMAAFMNHDGAGKQMTLGEILDRDQVWRG